jgi:glyoxylase-like metal-dependent hydrolase (beta-lactamase superfamily II)
MPIDVIDLNFRARSHVVGTAVLQGPDGVALVDPGPTSCLPSLEAGLAERGLTLRDVRTLLLTHIHFDHAGAAGSIVERVPGVQVFVHEHGARHMIDPSRLIASAARLWGDQMETLWGAFVPVPSTSVHTLKGGERIEVAGSSLQVAYTPGHAIHHVSYLDERHGVAYVGDTAGIRLNEHLLIAPTPPPDIDLEAWRDSLDRLDAWQPVSLMLTHFGEVTPARAHLARFRETLDEQAEVVRQSLELPCTDEDRARMFVDRLRALARQRTPESEAAATEIAAPFDQLWAGLARYWRKRQP